MTDQPASLTAVCGFCGKRWRKDDYGVRPAPGGQWACRDQAGCLERKAARPAILDVRDNPVPVISAREDLERAMYQMGMPQPFIDRLLAAADRYASAAVADHAGLDAMLGPLRLAEATDEREGKLR